MRLRTLSTRLLPLLLGLAALDLPAVEPPAPDTALAAAEGTSRHLITTQRLVVWLPDRFEVARSEPTVQELTDAGGDIAVRFIRTPLPPGLGLAHLVELTNRELADNGTLREIVDTVSTTVAGEAAVEVVADTTVEGVARSSRIVTTIDPDEGHYRLVALHCHPERQRECDAALAEVLRGFTPLDRVAWDPGFEQLRSRLDTVPGPLPRARFGSVLAAVDEPGAIGQPWVEEELGELGREAPVLLLDGLLHHHPRGRAACLEALVQLLETPTLRRAVLARALRDPDPVVRARGALHAAAGGDAAAVLPAVLSSDDSAARSGAFQLLALVEPAARRELLASLLAGRDQLPVESQELLVLALGEWGGEGSSATLTRIWERDLEPRLRDAALEELLRRGDARALTTARVRLADGSGPSGLDLAVAARHLAAHVTAASAAADWEALAEQLENGPEDGDRDRTAAAETLTELADFLRALPPAASTGDECAALRRMLLDCEAGDWVPERYARLSPSCAAIETAPRMRVEVPKPGALLLAYADLLDRLELGTAETNHMFHTVVPLVAQRAERAATDPIFSRTEMARATGVDFLAPWRWQGWLPRSPRGLAFAHESGFGMALAASIRCDNPDQLVELLVRASHGDLAPNDLVVLAGLLSTALPLLPAGLVAVWEEEILRWQGEDDETESGPKEVHVALMPQRQPDGTALFAIHRLVIPESQPARRDAVFVRVAGSDVTIAPDPELVFYAGEPTAAEVADTGDACTEVDLAALVRDRQPDYPLLPLLEPLRLRATAHVGSERIATTLTLDGLPAPWLSVARPSDPRRARSATTVLPADTLAWVVATFDPTELSRQLVEAQPGEATDPELERLADLVAASQGEAGLAVVGPPDDTADTDEPWLQTVVAFVAAPGPAADRYLKSLMPGSRVQGGVRVSADGTTVATSRDGFLLVGRSAALLRRMGKGPRLADNPLFQRLADRAPTASTVTAGGDVDALANAVLDALPADRSDRGLVTLGVELLRAFGPISATVTVAEGRLEGVVSVEPSLMDEDAHARVRRLVGFPGYTSGSIPVEGSPGKESPGLLEVTLELPEDGWSEPERWASTRLKVRRLGPTRYRLVSSSSEPLPETSRVTLPIMGEGVTPYLRAEADLAIRSAEVKALAEEIRGTESDPARIVRRVIEWGLDNVTYAVVRDADGVRHTLSSRQADCTEFAELTVALCRALGVPARAVGGMVLDEGVAILHAWVEVYLDRWYEVDPTSGQTELPASYVPLPDGSGFLLASTPGCRLAFEPAGEGDRASGR